MIHRVLNEDIALCNNTLPQIVSPILHHFGIFFIKNSLLHLIEY